MNIFFSLVMQEDDYSSGEKMPVFKVSDMVHGYDLHHHYNTQDTKETFIRKYLQRMNDDVIAELKRRGSI